MKASGITKSGTERSGVHSGSRGTPMYAQIIAARVTSAASE